MTRLDKHVAGVRNKMTLGKFVVVLGWTATVAAALIALAVVVNRLFGLTIPHPWLVVAGMFAVSAVVAYAMALFRRPSLQDAAVAIDQRLALKEKFSTALYIRNSKDPFAQAAVKDAERTAENVSIHKRFPLAIPRTGLLAAGIAALAFGLTFLPQWQRDAKADSQTAVALEDKQREQSRQILQKALVDVQALPKAEANSEAIKNAERELSEMLKNPPKETDAAQRTALKALSDSKEAIKESIAASEKFASAVNDRKFFNNLAPGANEKGPVAEAERAIAQGNFDQAVKNVDQAVKNFDKMDQKEKDKTAANMQAMAQQLQQIANNPQMQQQMQQQIQRMGGTQQQAQQMMQQMQQAAAGNQQAAQQAQQTAQQLMKQMNGGNGPTQQQQQNAQQMMKQMQAQANSQMQAQQLAQAAQQMGLAMKQAAGGAQQQANGQQKANGAQQGGQQGQQGGQQAGQQAQQGGQQAGQQGKQGGQQGGQQMAQQGAQQGGQLGGQQGGQQPGGQQAGTQQGQQPGGQQGGQQAGGQQGMAAAQQAMQQQLDAMQAAQNDAQQVAAAQQALNEAAAEQQNNMNKGNGQGQNGQGQQAGQGQGPWAQGNPQGKQGGGMGGPGIGNGGQANKTVAPFTTKAEHVETENDPNGKVLASFLIKDPKGEKGESHEALKNAVAAAKADATEEVEQDHIGKQSEMVVKDYFNSMESAPPK